MSGYIDVLITKMHEYCTGEISRDSLSEWAENLLNSLLRNRELIYIDKFVIYPFISGLAIRKESLEFLNDSCIEEYLEILNGNSNMKYSCYMKIPKEVNISSIENVVELIDKYNRIGHMSDNDFDVIDNLIEKRDIMSIHTFCDYLFCDIVAMLSDLPKAINTEIYASSVFIGEDDLKSSDIISRLYNTIECYKGNRAFRVNLVYQNGNYILGVSA